MNLFSNLKHSIGEALSSVAYLMKVCTLFRVIPAVCKCYRRNVK